MASRIVAVGCAAPRTAISNHDLEKRMDTTDEWIRTRTGICSRNVMRTGESLVDVTAQACRIALDRAALKPSDLDAIVVGTISSEFGFPSFGCQLQHALGIDTIPAFDVAAACSGFVYAISVADSMMRAGDFTRVLVVGTDALSTMVDWNDRAVAVLFGDGAGAAVMVREAGDRGVLASLLRSSGALANLLSVRSTGVRGPIDAEVLRSPDDAIHMKGPELFKVAVKFMAEVTKEVMARAGFEVGGISLVIPHQANKRITDAVADRLGLPREKMYVNLDRYGNTSAASIPIALDEALAAGRIRDNDLVVFNAAGGGLTWGANLIRW